VVGEGKVVELRHVTLGPVQDDGTVVVEDGLAGDETYIVNGLLRARPGFPVTPQTEAEASGDAVPESEDRPEEEAPAMRAGESVED
jgi:hypothetical protein